MDAEELAFAGIARQAELIRAGEVSSRELTETYLERIERLGPRLNVLTEVLADYLSACKATGHPASKTFWMDRFQLGKDDRKGRKSAATKQTTALELMFADWQKNLDRAREAWELETISQLRATLLKELAASS